VTVFVENFPGIPDNIVLSHKSGLVWVGFAIKRTRPFSVFDFLADKPWIRLAIARLLPVPWAMKLVIPYGLVLGLDPITGDVKCNLQDPRASIAFISEVHEFDDGSLLFGSFRNPFLGYLPTYEC